MPSDWHPTDDQLIAALESGVKRAEELLQYCGVDTNDASRKGFFKHPCKHFPLKDVYDVRNDSSTSDLAGDNEDPPDERPPHLEDVDVTTIDAEDAADAAALIAQLMRNHPRVGEVEGRLGSADAKSLAHEVQSLVNNFNQSIQEEAKDRKYRFVVKRVSLPPTQSFPTISGLTLCRCCCDAS